MSNGAIDVRHFGGALDNNYVLILTSNSVEKARVNQVIDEQRKAATGIQDRGSKIGFIGQRVVLHVSGESGGSRPGSIGRITSRLLSDAQVPKPCLVALVGFCWVTLQGPELGT